MKTGIGFQVASPGTGTGGTIPRTVELALAAGYAESQGALLLIDANGKFDACAADPALVAAVALTPGGTDSSGFNILGKKEYPPGYMQGVVLSPNQQFIAPVVNGPLAAAGAGAAQYGVTRDVDGVWKVDGNKLGVNPVVIFQGQPVFSPADAVGSGQNTEVLVTFVPGVIQPI